MSPSVEPLPVQKLDEILAQSLGKDFRVEQLEWKPLTAPGENFGSVMLAITVALSRTTGKKETMNLVAKLPPTTPYLLELFNSPVTFKKELHFYDSMAKEFAKLQLENGVNEKDLAILTPEYLGGRLGLNDPEVFDEQAVIVLENLKNSGFDCEDRILGLDEKHTAFAIEGLAKLHALTIALRIKKPLVYERVAGIVLATVLNEMTEKCVLDMLRKSQSDVEELEEAKPYLERIRRTIEHGILWNRQAKRPEEPWGTLVHNDFWVNNMMFRHDARGQPVAMKIVDFQLCVYDYGIMDLIFFLVSSANRETLDGKLDRMIDLYYECFAKCLKTLNVDTEKFSKRRFDELVNLCAPAKFNQCIMMTQVIQAPRGSTPEMKDVKGKDVFMKSSDDGTYKRKLIQIVRLFDKKGWLLK